MSEPTDTGESELMQLALRKMGNVLGKERAAALFRRIQGTTGVTLRSPDELHVFATELSRMGGFEGAVGAMLQVTAVMRGAKDARNQDS